MCGLCIEAEGFDLVLEAQKKNQKPQLDLFFYEFYLQEEDDLSEALRRGVTLAKSNDYKPLTVISPTTFICRHMDILLVHGSRSKEYQKVLELPSARDLLQQAFSAEETQKLTFAENKFGFRRLKRLYDQEGFENAVIDDQPFEEDLQVIRELVPLFGQVGGGNKVESHRDYAASLRGGPA